MSKEFSVFVKYLKKLKERYFFTLSAFFVYEGLRELSADNIVGEKEADRNVKTMNRFNEFFGSSKEALRVYFLLELAKLFDSSNQALHVDKIVNFAQSNIKKFSVSDFVEFNQDNKFIKELVANYNGISNKDLQRLRLLISSQKDTIDNLKIYRDKYLAHDDLVKVNVDNLNPEKIKNLFSIIEEILNLFSSKLDDSITKYDHIENICKDKTKMVVEYLERFEPYRLEEIRKEIGGY